jgi:hypothetical protein
VTSGYIARGRDLTGLPVVRYVDLYLIKVPTREPEHARLCGSADAKCGVVSTEVFDDR